MKRVDAMLLDDDVTESDIQAFANGSRGIKGTPLAPGMILVRKGEYVEAYALVVAQS